MRLINLLVFVLGSLGPSTVTLIAFIYVATMTGRACTIMDIEKLFPESRKMRLIDLTNKLNGNFPILTSTTPPNKSQIVKLCDMILHHGRAIPQLSATILVIPCFHCDQSSVLYFIQGHDL